MAPFEFKRMRMGIITKSGRTEYKGDKGETEIKKPFQDRGTKVV